MKMKRICMIFVLLLVCASNAQMFPDIGTVVAGKVTHGNETVANANVTVIVERTLQTKTAVSSDKERDRGSYSVIGLNAKAGDKLKAVARHGNLEGNGSVVCDGSTLPQRINIELHEVQRERLGMEMMLPALMLVILILIVVAIKKIK